MSTPVDPDAIVRALRAALPTSRHARLLYDAVADGLGEGGVEHTVNGGTRRTLYLARRGRGPDVVPWPLLVLDVRGRIGFVMPLGESEFPALEEKKAQAPAPKLRNLGPGEIELHDGPETLTLTYGEDGRWFECSRRQDLASLAPLCEALARGGAHGCELLADALLAVDLERHGPARVLYPAPLPAGVAYAYQQGLRAARRALFEDRLPPEAGVVVTDGIAGTALAWGRTEEEARAAWRAQVEAAQPRPPKPPPPPEPAEEEPEAPFDPPEPYEPEDPTVRVIPFFSGPVRLRGPTPDVPWPEPTLETTPAVVIPVEAVRTEPSTFGAWVRLLDGFGQTTHALLRQDPAGFTLVGDQVALREDLAALDERLAEAKPLTVPRRPGRPAYDCHRSFYRLFDDHTREPVPARVAESGSSWGFDPSVLDGARLRWRVLRQRWGAAPGES